MIYNFPHYVLAADRAGAVDDIASQLLAGFSPNRTADPFYAQTRHPFIVCFLRLLFVKLRKNHGDGRNAHIRFKIHAVANDRWRTEASMPGSYNDGVGIFLYLCE